MSSVPSICGRVVGLDKRSTSRPALVFHHRCHYHFSQNTSSPGGKGQGMPRNVRSRSQPIIQERAKTRLALSWSLKPSYRMQKAKQVWLLNGSCCRLIPRMGRSVAVCPNRGPLLSSAFSFGQRDRLWTICSFPGAVYNAAQSGKSC